MKKPKGCILCGSIKVIHARGLCNNCYARETRNGNLHKYESSSARHPKRFGNCVDCGKHVEFRLGNRCAKCTSVWKASFPDKKSLHTAVVREWRKNNPKKDRAIDRRRNRTEKRKAWRVRYNREYRKKNAKKLKAYYRKWDIKNPERRDDKKRRYRARKRNAEATLTHEEWKCILNKHNHMCIYCGAADKKLVREHWIPVSRGGGYTKENIVPSCESCNLRKGTMTGNEFLARLPIEENFSKGNASENTDATKCK